MKGYKINLSKIDEGYLFSDFICTAEKISEAKSKLLKDVQYESLCLFGSGDEVTYLTIPVIRAKEYDLINYKGNLINRFEIARIEASEKHHSDLDKILSDKKISHCYIKKRGSFYADNHNGYTEFRIHAGIYLKDEAVRSARSCEELDIIPIDIKEHNEYLNGHIEKIKAHLI